MGDQNHAGFFYCELLVLKHKIMVLKLYLKERLQHWCFTTNFAKFLRIPFEGTPLCDCLLTASNFIYKETWSRLPVNSAEFFKVAFFTGHLWSLLLSHFTSTQRRIQNLVKHLRRIDFAKTVWLKVANPSCPVHLKKIIF